MDDYMEYALDATFEEPEDIRTCGCCGRVFSEDKFTNDLGEFDICDDCFYDMRKALRKFLGGEANEMTHEQKELAVMYLDGLESMA